MIEPELNTWDEDEGAESDGADERDNDARVPHRKSQQVSYQEHRDGLWLKFNTSM